MTDVKVFAMYLPQFHETKENSLFWGEGFTDWVSVKKATPLFSDHKQPQIPLNGYYDLSLEEDILDQVEMANQYGVSGWGIYHYWFNSQQRTLTKPAEIILKNKNWNIPFFFAWDNISWKRTWSKLKGNDWAPSNENESKNKGPEILIEYKLGGESDWDLHFSYLLPYFKDDRYVKKQQKPLFLIFHYSDAILKMAERWNTLAKDAGFAGMEIIYNYKPFFNIPHYVNKFCYEPPHAGWGSMLQRVSQYISGGQDEIKKYSYEKVWSKIIKSARRCKDPNMYYGAFVGYDDSPRRGNKGKIITGGTPQLFETYLKSLIEISERQNKEYIFLTAWNEWGEGAHLEPSKEDEFSYLEAYRNAINMVKGTSSECKG